MTPLYIQWDQAGGANAIRTAFDFSSAYATESSLLARVTAQATSSEALALVTLAELNKTMGLIGDLGRQADRFTKAFVASTKNDKKRFRKMTPRQMARVGGELASSWLAYRYGIMATYYDVMSWVAGHRRVGSRPRGRFYTATETLFDPGLTTTQTYSGELSDNYNTDRLRRHTVSSAGVIIGFDAPVSHLEAFGADKLLSTAWELIPYSFVADWFIDAGTRIAALEGSVLRPVLGSWITHRHRLWRYYGAYITPKILDTPSLNGYLEFSNYYANINDNTMVVERKANPKLSALPELKVNLNTKRALDGISLLISSSKRMK